VEEINQNFKDFENILHNILKRGLTIHNPSGTDDLALSRLCYRAFWLVDSISLYLGFHAIKFWISLRIPVALVTQIFEVLSKSHSAYLGRKTRMAQLV